MAAWDSDSSDSDDEDDKEEKIKLEKLCSRRQSANWDNAVEYLSLKWLVIHGRAARAKPEKVAAKQLGVASLCRTTRAAPRGSTISI